MRENSIYTITPPDMMLSEGGPTVTVISTDESFIKKVEGIQENIFKTVPVNIYHPNGQVNEKKLAWLISVIRLSDSVYVDLNTVNDLALLTTVMVAGDAILINEGNKRNDIAKLFNSVMPDGFQVYDSLDIHLDVMLNRLGLQ